MIDVTNKVPNTVEAVVLTTSAYIRMETYLAG
jgi:hypothetical protein